MVGRPPPLGYDVDPATRKLVVNEEEAARVREIFDLYLRYGALLPVVRELGNRDWRTKRWVTRKGNTKGGRAFTKTDLYELLTNVAYLGRVRYKEETHPGEHATIVAAEPWEAAQSRLRENGRCGRPTDRLRSGALLAGLLRCKPCGCAMTPAHATKGNRRYRYYTCTGAQKRGRHTCPSGSVRR